MADIGVERTRGDGTHAFDVTLSEGGSSTVHHVTLADQDYRRLGGGHPSPEAFVRACFEFLLQREPKESILSRFDVSVISRYFPEFEETIRSG